MSLLEVVDKKEHTHPHTHIHTQPTVKNIIDTKRAKLIHAK